MKIKGMSDSFPFTEDDFRREVESFIPEYWHLKLYKNIITVFIFQDASTTLEFNGESSSDTFIVYLDVVGSEGSLQKACVDFCMNFFKVCIEYDDDFWLLLKETIGLQSDNLRSNDEYTSNLSLLICTYLKGDTGIDDELIENVDRILRGRYVSTVPALRHGLEWVM